MILNENEFVADDMVDNSCYMDEFDGPDDDMVGFDDEPDVDDWNGFIFGKDDEFDHMDLDGCGYYDE